MNYTIKVETKSTGNESIGQHYYETIIVFDWQSSHKLISARQEQIVKDIIGLDWMYYDAKEVADAIWEVKHGYNSGD